VFHAIRPGEFDGLAEKHSRSKAPSSEPINPMAPTVKQKHKDHQQRSVYLEFIQLLLLIIWTEEAPRHIACSYVSGSPGIEPSLAPPPAPTMQRTVTVDPRFGFHSNEPSSFHAKSLVPCAPATFNTRSTASQGSTMTPSMSTTAANLGSRSCSNGPFHFRATPAAREDGMLQKAIAPAPNVQHRHIIDPSLGLTCCQVKSWPDVRQLYLFQEPQIMCQDS